MTYLQSYEDFLEENEEKNYNTLNSILESFDYETINEEEATEWVGLLSAALAAGGMAATLITLFIKDVKKYKSSHPNESLVSCVKVVRKSFGKGAENVRKNIG